MLLFFPMHRVGGVARSISEKPKNMDKPLLDSQSVPYVVDPELANLILAEGALNSVQLPSYDKAGQLVNPQAEPVQDLGFSVKVPLLLQDVEPLQLFGTPADQLEEIGNLPHDNSTTFDKFYIDTATSIMLTIVIGLCHEPGREYSTSELSPKLKAVCREHTDVHSQPAQIANRQYGDTCPSSYLYKLKAANAQHLLPIIDQRYENKHLLWSTRFPIGLAARIFSISRRYASLGEIAREPIPEWPEGRTYTSRNYQDFLFDLVQHFSITTADGQKYYIVFRTALVNNIVDYLKKKNICIGKNDKAFNLTTRTMQSTKYNGRPLFVKMKSGDETWWLLSEHFAPRTQQVFTVIPSTKWRNDFASVVPLSMYAPLNTDVDVSVRGPLANLDKLVVPQGAEKKKTQQAKLGSLSLVDPDISNFSFEALPHSTEQPSTELQSSSEAQPPPRNAVLDTARHLAEHPEQIPSVYFTDIWPTDRELTPLEKMFREKSIESAALYAALALTDLNPPPASNSNASKKRTFDEGELSPPKRVKPSSNDAAVVTRLPIPM